MPADLPAALQAALASCPTPDYDALQQAADWWAQAALQQQVVPWVPVPLIPAAVPSDFVSRKPDAQPRGLDHKQAGRWIVRQDTVLAQAVRWTNNWPLGDPVQASDRTKAAINLARRYGLPIGIGLCLPGNSGSLALDADAKAFPGGRAELDSTMAPAVAWAVEHGLYVERSGSGGLHLLGFAQGDLGDLAGSFAAGNGTKINAGEVRGGPSNGFLVVAPTWIQGKTAPYTALHPLDPSRGATWPADWPSIDIAPAKHGGGGGGGGGRGVKGNWIESSPDTPCPICSRSDTGACSFTNDRLYATCRISDRLPVVAPHGDFVAGDIITGADGLQWEFVKQRFVGGGIGLKRHFRRAFTSRRGPVFSLNQAASSTYPRPQVITDALVGPDGPSTAEPLGANAALVLLTDDCGTGKTHDVDDAVRVLTARMPSARAVYIGDRWRLPPAASLRRWAPIPTRHPALKDRLLDGGEVERIWCPPGESGDIPPSCAYPYRIRAFAAQGGSLDSITTACKACSLRNCCTYASNDGRFKHDLHSPAGIQRILAPPHLLARLKALSGPNGWVRTFIFIDELSCLASALSTTYTIPWARLGTWASWLRAHDRAFDEVLDLLAALQDIPHHLDGKATIYGLTHAELRERVPPIAGRLALGAALVLDPGIGDVEDDSGVPLLLDPILDALAGLGGATVRASTAGLELNVPSAAVRESIKGCGGVVLMDATASREDAVAALLAPDNDMRVETVQTAAPADLANVSFIQIPCLGAMGGQRRQALSYRRNALVDAIKALHGGSAGVIDLKQHIREGEHYWHRHHRSVNAFIDQDALILVGLPRPNLSEHLARVGGSSFSDPRVQDAMAQELGRELWQAIHRLRPARRTDRRLVVYFICNDSLNGMPFGSRVQRRKAADLTSGAADSLGRLVNAIRQGGDITQEQAAEAIGCTPRHVKRIVQGTGLAWRDFRRQHQGS